MFSSVLGYGAGIYGAALNPMDNVYHSALKLTTNDTLHSFLFIHKAVLKSLPPYI